MATAVSSCAHCGVAISDPTTQVVHGGVTYCCPNCSAAMEQGGGGSDPHATNKSGELHCAHCGSAIVDENTMVTSGDDAFCCVNCSRAANG
jgi:DNA-directed RNA polymerase subunit RPC12/RpoP